MVWRVLIPSSRISGNDFVGFHHSNNEVNNLIMICLFYVLQRWQLIFIGRNVELGY